MSKETKQMTGRRMLNSYQSPFEPYDLEGPLQKNMSLHRLTLDDATGVGGYVIRMEPGAETIWHEHKMCENYLILEGDLIEADGRVLKPGDFVSYRPGTRHNSRTEGGCLLIGLDHRP